jgi:hypothetical protein
MPRIGSKDLESERFCSAGPAGYDAHSLTRYVTRTRTVPLPRYAHEGRLRDPPRRYRLGD